MERRGSERKVRSQLSLPLCLPACTWNATDWACCTCTDPPHFLLLLLLCVWLTQTADAKISSSKDIWMMLASMEPKQSQVSSPEEADAKSNNSNTLAQEEKDTFSLIVGSKGAGKTSLTSCFRNSAKGVCVLFVSLFVWRYAH